MAKSLDAIVPRTRSLNLMIFLACTSIIGVSLYMEHVLLLPPCGLCITQRVFVILVGQLCLASAIHNPPAMGTPNYSFAHVGMGLRCG